MDIHDFTSPSARGLKRERINILNGVVIPMAEEEKNECQLVREAAIEVIQETCDVPHIIDVMALSWGMTPRVKDGRWLSDAYEDFLATSIDEIKGSDTTRWILCMCKRLMVKRNLPPDSDGFVGVLHDAIDALVEARTEAAKSQKTFL